MTLPLERRNAVRETKDFLRDLLDPKKTPGVPRSVRDRAAACLRHYPWDYLMDDGLMHCFWCERKKRK